MVRHVGDLNMIDIERKVRYRVRQSVCARCGNPFDQRDIVKVCLTCIKELSEIDWERMIRVQREGLRRGSWVDV